MEYQSKFIFKGELKAFNLYTSSRAPYAFATIITKRSGASNSVSLFGDTINQLTSDDVGKQVEIEGYVNKYKSKTTGQYEIGFVAQHVNVIEETQAEIKHQAPETSAPWATNDEPVWD